MTKKHRIGFAVLLSIGFGVEGVVAPVPVQQVQVVTGFKVVMSDEMSRDLEITEMPRAVDISPALSHPMPFAEQIPGVSLPRGKWKP